MVRCLVFFFLVFLRTLFSLPTDFDVVVVGTSPICLIEALYRYHSGNRVLIIDEAEVCGGAWKSINICGIKNVDLGCHTIGHNQNILFFLEEYVGCNMVSMDDPERRFEVSRGGNGYYPSKGCFEIVHNLVRLIEATNIALLLNHHLDSVYIHDNEPIATIKTRNKKITTNKILTTQCSNIKVENHPNRSFASQMSSTSKYHHIYLLIEDASQPKFSYRNGGGNGISRMVNLTHFVEMQEPGTQLIVLQVNDSSLSLAESYFQRLKNNGLIDLSARLIKADNYIYEQSSYNAGNLQNIKNARCVFEMLTTGDIQSMASYIPKWKNVLKPFHFSVQD